MSQVDTTEKLPDAPETESSLLAFFGLGIAGIAMLAWIGILAWLAWRLIDWLLF